MTEKGEKGYFLSSKKKEFKPHLPNNKTPTQKRVPRSDPPRISQPCDSRPLMMRHGSLSITGKFCGLPGMNGSSKF